MINGFGLQNFINRTFPFIVLFMLVAVWNSAAQLPNDRDSSRLKKKIFLPVVAYSPETQLAFGGLAIALWHPTETKAIHSRTSNAEVVGLFTTRRQTIIIPKYTIFTTNEKYYFEGIAEILLSYPDYYYGIGNNTSIKNQENVSYQLLGWEAEWLKKMIPGRKIFVGLVTRYFRRSDVDYKKGGLLDTEKPTGYNGNTSVGIGPALTWDERDNVLNPTKGFFIDGRYTMHGKVLGGTVRYNRYLIDLRKYISLSSQRYSILAMQLFGHFTNGSVPWKELPELGGPRIMRGYYRGRFRDKNLMAVQAEYRATIYKWIGAVAFAGLGKVSGSDEFSFNNLKTCYGAGLRAKINKKENLNLRIDLAKGDKDRGAFFYFGLAESF